MTKKRIMCFGDSLTWGWDPVVEGIPSTRFADDVRWTGIVARELGADYQIIEEGLSGRTTNIVDPIDPRLDGSAYLPAALASHFPLDLVTIMLGTNDTKAYYHRSALEISQGLSQLVGFVQGSAGGVGTNYPAPQVLIIAPPPLSPMPHPYFEAVFGGGYEKSRQLGKLYGDLADFLKVPFLNAGDFISTDGVDGIHFNEQNNADLGKAVADKIRSILE